MCSSFDDAWNELAPDSRSSCVICSGRDAAAAPDALVSACPAKLDVWSCLHAVERSCVEVDFDRRLPLKEQPRKHVHKLCTKAVLLEWP